MSAATCSERGRFAYFATLECSEQQPEGDGHFDAGEKEKNVYKCDSAHPYLDVSGEKARCISTAKCFDNDGLEYVADYGKEPQCVSRARCNEIGYALRIQCLTKQQCESRYYQ